MSTLRELLATWENWSARDALIRALGNVTTDDSRIKLTEALDGMPHTRALDALQDSAEVVALLAGWQWQAVYAARVDGASWAHIAAATGKTPEQAREHYRTAVEQQQRYGISDTARYREVL